MRHPFLRTLAGSAATPTDPNFESVTLLLHGDGTNGGQNNTFVDGSTNNFTITRNGNTTQGTFSPYGDNWSNYFDGTGDYLTFGTGVTLSGDFCAECWYYQTASPTTRSTVFGNDSSAGGTTNHQFAVTNTGGVTMILSASTVINNVGTAAVQNQWNHIAWVRSGTSCAIFVNGTRQGTGTSSVATSICRRIGDAVSTAGYLPIGYISDARIVTGSSVYDPSSTTITVPSSRLTAISGTQLLTCQSNRFRDASTNNFTITRNGDVSVQRFSPFSPTAAYAAGTIGGSGYFDGALDHLRLPPSSAFSIATATTPFTIECWIYPTAAGGAIFSEQYGISGNDVDIAISMSGSTTNVGDTTGRYIGFGWHTNPTWTTAAISNTQVVLHQWTHVVCVFTGSTTKIFLNGVDSTAATPTPATTWGRTGSSGTEWYVGKRWDNASTPYFTGYISNFRFVNGTAVYASNFTPPASPLTAITNTSLLLNFTNAAILDNAMMAVPETVGNAQISTSVKKYGTGSLYFDGTGDYLFAPVNQGYVFGTGDFTVEYWLYPISVSSGTMVDLRSASSGAGAISYSDYITAASKYALYFNANTYTSTASLAANQWTHIAVSRSGTNLRVFLNGVQDGATVTNSQDLQGGMLRVGNNFPATAGLNGYIDDLRITKGIARYTSNFTPPTAALPDL